MDRYEEALERAKKAVKEGMVSQSFVDEIFGVQESEDERIRRKMVEHFKSKTKETWCNIPVKNIIAYLEKQKEQKPTNLEKPKEWSEEDVKYLNLAINIVASDLGEDSPTVSWLKSLRLQPQWKPSKEQMEALYNAQRELCGTKYNEGLCSLIDCLKKL